MAHVSRDVRSRGHAGAHVQLLQQRLLQALQRAAQRIAGHLVQLRIVPGMDGACRDVSLALLLACLSERSGCLLSSVNEQIISYCFARKMLSACVTAAFHADALRHCITRIKSGALTAKPARAMKCAPVDGGT